MLKVKPETEEALKAGRVISFVFFDFMFFPMRVHSGKETLEWDGYTWEGVSNTLRPSFRVASILADPPPSSSASLPWDKTTSEIVAKGYYRGRTMELFVCSLDEQGNVIERVAYVSGTMVEFSHKDNVITFRAQDDTFDSIKEKDARHKKTIEAHRQQFKWYLSDTASSSAIGWLLNLIGAFLGNVLGVCVDAITMLFMSDKRRAVVQRWRARKRVYWFTTEPQIPRIGKRKKGYKIRADTLDEAKMKLYREVAAKIWLFPRGWISMIVTCDGRPLEFFDLDHVRKHDDMKRWEETSPIHQWGKVDNGLK